ncbi:DNA-binding protein WhiA [Spiroplasma chinense]|uniref:Probable cell division protein WhiA n=1 Tax=Spiroplasma chinense TaxID=216932 RepID=A0A5B9Y3E0_9MOLU|nr:DNA-binding protein WhiA [Spiroplasma chinense]QEH61305.1 DNA-binding protein WhiA [Spiroplasma chinense]
MSFAREVKEEILNHTFSQEQAKALLCGFIKYNGELIFTNKGFALKLTSTSNNIIRKIFSLLKEIYSGNIDISIVQTQKLNRDKVYELVLTDNIQEFLAKNYIYDIGNNVKIIEINLKNDHDNSLVRAYISGVFIAIGSVNSPETTNYHLEFQTKELESANYLKEILNSFEFDFKVINKRTKYICYAKKSLVVSDFLKFVDASRAVMKFETTRINRDVSNNVNRMMNIDIYNQQKTLSAGSQQVKEIELIMEKRLFNELSEKAQKLATIRLANRDASYSELELMMNETGIAITKSGISNLFKIIKKLAESIGD